MEIFKSFTFEAAHRLPNLPPEHKCHRIHGHTFTVTVHLSGSVDPHTGWIADFAEIKEAIEPLLKRLDHRYLNEIEGLENPTSENLARYIWQAMQPKLATLSKVVVQENPSCGAIYRGEDE